MIAPLFCPRSLDNLFNKSYLEIVSEIELPNKGSLRIYRTIIGNIAYFTAVANTSTIKFETTSTTYTDSNYRYRYLTDTSYAGDGDDLNIGLTGDINNSNIIVARIRRVNANQATAISNRVVLICEII